MLHDTAIHSKEEHLDKVISVDNNSFEFQKLNSSNSSSVNIQKIKQFTSEYIDSPKKTTQLSNVESNATLIPDPRM